MITATSYISTIQEEVFALNYLSEEMFIEAHTKFPNMLIHETLQRNPGLENCRLRNSLQQIDRHLCKN